MLVFQDAGCIYVDYKYRVEWTILKRSWFVNPTSIKYVSKQKNV